MTESGYDSIQYNSKLTDNLMSTTISMTPTLDKDGTVVGIISAKFISFTGTV